MSDPISELASVVLRKSPDYLIRTVWRVLAASGWPIIHDLADAEFVSGHWGSSFMVGPIARLHGRTLDRLSLDFAHVPTGYGRHVTM